MIFYIHTIERIEKWIAVDAETEDDARVKVAMGYTSDNEDGVPERYNIDIIFDGDESNMSEEDRKKWEQYAVWGFVTQP